MLYRIKMPETYVVHLGNSKELMEVAEDSVAKRILCEHVRESLGVWNEDLIFAIINSALLVDEINMFSFISLIGESSIVVSHLVAKYSTLFLWRNLSMRSDCAYNACLASGVWSLVGPMQTVSKKNTKTGNWKRIAFFSFNTLFFVFFMFFPKHDYSCS